MTSITNFYPFLISRSVDLDYRVIVSPRFLLDKKLLHLLMATTDEEQETQPELILHRQVDREFTIIFRVEVATYENIGKNSSEILRDNGFRPIYMIIGAVCEESLSREKVKITSEDFQEINSKIRETYTAFWNEGNTKIFISNRLSSEFNQGNHDETLKVKTLSIYKKSFNKKEAFSPVSLTKVAPRKTKIVSNMQLIVLVILAALMASSFLSKVFFLKFLQILTKVVSLN